MKKARIFLASLAIVGIVGGAVAAKFSGTIFWTATVYGAKATSVITGSFTTVTTVSATYYYYTTVGSTPAYYYSIIKLSI